MHAMIKAKHFRRNIEFDTNVWVGQDVSVHMTLSVGRIDMCISFCEFLLNRMISRSAPANILYGKVSREVQKKLPWSFHNSIFDSQHVISFCQ